MVVVEVQLIEHGRYTGVIEYNNTLYIVSLGWLTHKIGYIYYIEYLKLRSVM